MKEFSPAELAQLCQKTIRGGDTRAFEEIVARYKKKVFSIAYRLLDSREEAEDAAQEVFLKIYRGIENLSEPATFEAWLRRVTINVCLDAIEKRKRSPKVQISLDGSEEETKGSADAASNPAKMLEEKEALNCLKKALARLDSVGRSAVVLRDVEEFSYDEIAASLEISLSAAKMRIHRARLAIQKLLEEICPGLWRANSA
jgi:RNA polymerase sigma-70 factor (ECF subfamily)